MYGTKKKLGFGCMRLPMKDEKPDREKFSEMVDLFIDSGFNYFDTAHGYHGGQSEVALHDCLTTRYPRDAYILTDKLSDNFFSSEEDIRPFFESQLDTLGVEYLDFYLMHAQDETNYEKYKKCRAYETAFELKEEGKIKHVGISFHDRASVLEKILTEYPEVEVVQIQLNYIDFEASSVQSRLCLEVCRKHGKPAIVMEPVKGGALAKVPDEAAEVFRALGGSPASYALRFAADQEGVFMVLSGMSDLEMTKENIAVMSDPKPLSEEELAAIDRVREIFSERHAIPCTSCRYCTERCPVGIPIPEIFSCLNTKEEFGTWNANFYYSKHTSSAPKASECLGCGACEDACPQHIEIRSLLERAVELFEKED
ncbi:MAG: aldo/keto reductase [Clostridia bacterium]|nr:aldo/keto reductase [Clostridia bacterium]